MEKTEIQANVGTIIRHIIAGILYRIVLTLGYYIDYCQRTYTAYREYKLRMHEGSLSPERIEHERLLCTNKSQEFINARQVPFRDEDLITPANAQTAGAKILVDTLQAHNSNIHSAFNVGGYNDVHFSFAANNFADINFTTVDFHHIEDLMHFNRLLPQSTNWNFVSGYPLDVLRQGKVGCDLVFFSSTSTLINSREMDDYIDVFAERSKVIVLNESWAPYPPKGNPFKFYKPEDISPDESIVRSVDQYYSWFQHNYPEKFRRKGFRIETSQLIDVSKTYFVLQIVALNTKFL